MPRANVAAKDDELAQLERRKRVAQLYLEGKPQWEIATIVNVAQGTISKDLTWIREQWTKSAVMDMNERMALELARIDRLEEVMWEAWWRSCQDAEGETIRRVKVPQEKMRVGPGGKLIPTGETEYVVSKELVEKYIKGRLGDVRYAERVSWCIEMRCKLTGLLKPDKTTNNVVVLPDGFWESLSQRPEMDDPLQRKIREVEDLTNVKAIGDKK